MKDDGPYRPKYKGFDGEATRRAQATADRARDSAGAKGEDANKEYVDGGPEEAARRSGTTADEVGHSVERARARKR